MASAKPSRQYPVTAGGAKGVRGKNQQAGVTRALTQARQPRPSPQGRWNWREPNPTADGKPNADFPWRRDASLCLFRVKPHEGAVGRHFSRVNRVHFDL
jgi:hypothetical protein